MLIADSSSCWLLNVFYCCLLLLTALIHVQEEAREAREDAAPDTEANKYMPCLLAACGSGVPKVVTTALDAIVKV